MKSLSAVSSLTFCVAIAGMVRDSAAQVVIRPDKQITKPLDKSGHVDYLEAVNRRYSKGVTAATNWENESCRAVRVPSGESFGPLPATKGLSPVTCSPSPRRTEAPSDTPRNTAFTVRPSEVTRLLPSQVNERTKGPSAGESGIQSAAAVASTRASTRASISGPWSTHWRSCSFRAR